MKNKKCFGFEVEPQHMCVLSEPVSNDNEKFYAEFTFRFIARNTPPIFVGYVNGLKSGDLRRVHSISSVNHSTSTSRHDQLTSTSQLD